MDTPQTGVVKTVVTNGNGDRLEVYTATAKRAQIWIALLLGICTLATIVFGAARFGMQHEIHETIDAEISPPDGVIYRMSEDCAEKHIGKVGEELDELENNVIRLETKQGTIIERQQQQHDEQMRILREIRGSG